MMPDAITGSIRHPKIPAATPGSRSVPTAYRARDHGTLASVPGCIAKDLTRPSRKTEQDRRNAQGAGSLALLA
jgi:hypothetical protein